MYAYISWQSVNRMWDYHSPTMPLALQLGSLCGTSTCHIHKPFSPCPAAVATDDNQFIVSSSPPLVTHMLIHGLSLLLTHLHRHRVVGSALKHRTHDRASRKGSVRPHHGEWKQYGPHKQTDRFKKGRLRACFFINTDVLSTL